MTETVVETVRNGVDTATLDAIKSRPEIGQLRFRATNRWIDGAHNRSTIKDFYAACAEDTSRSAARKVRLTSIESTLEGELDLQGAMGLSEEHRNGFTQIRMTITISGDAPPRSCARSCSGTERSVVFDSVTVGVPVTVDVVTA